MNKWIAEFELEDGDTMPEHMDLEYKGARLDFYCRPMWIPISERLPEDGRNVLFCDIDGDIMIGYHIKGRPTTHFSQCGTYDDMKNVRAWMPLPDPYKAESEDKE